MSTPTTSRWVADSDSRPGAGGPTSGTASDEAPPERRGRKGLVIALIAVALALVGVLATAFVVFSSSGAAAKAPTAGVVIPLDDMTVNLANGRFLKVGVALQGTDKASADMDVSAAKDLVIQTYSGRDIGDLATTQQRNDTKKQLLKQLDVAYPGKFMDVYFTDFVTQ